MNETNSNTSSRTDWDRLDALSDADIDTSDTPPLTDEFFARASWLLPGERPSRPTAEAQTGQGTAGPETVRIELDLDPQTLAWFQSQGQGYERRMQAALRLYAEAHQAVA